VSIRQWYGYKLDEYATLRESSKWDFVNKLESRIAYWQAESLSPSKRPESPLPGPSLSTKSHIVEQFRRHIEHQGELEHERRLRAIREGKEAPSEPQREESIAGQINRLRRECNWTEEQLAEKVGVTTRTVQRHLAEDSMPYARHIATYERVFSKQLEREVVIRKMS
jgi:DNA-binding XRE family transcriptional regulator